MKFGWALVGRVMSEEVRSVSLTIVLGARGKCTKDLKNGKRDVFNAFFVL